METKPIKINQTEHSVNTVDSLDSVIDKLPKDEYKICEVLHRFNMLRSYPLSRKEILEWKDAIKMFHYKQDLFEVAEKIDFVINKMMLGEIDYNSRAGIQNIFNGLDKIEGQPGKFQVRFFW